MSRSQKVIRIKVEADASAPFIAAAVNFGFLNLPEVNPKFLKKLALTFTSKLVVVRDLRRESSNAIFPMVFDKLSKLAIAERSFLVSVYADFYKNLYEQKRFLPTSSIFAKYLEDNPHLHLIFKLDSQQGASKELPVDRPVVPEHDASGSDNSYSIAVSLNPARSSSAPNQISNPENGNGQKDLVIHSVQSDGDSHLTEQKQQHKAKNEEFSPVFVETQERDDEFGSLFDDIPVP